MRTLVVGDIHGAYKALLQCFERSGFNYDSDRLIVLGDVCDGYPEVRQCIDELLKIKKCDFIIGNHDMWALDWALRGDKPEIWTSQGGRNTMRSYDGGPMPKEHIDFLKGGQLWLELGDQLFVHGGFNPDTPLSKHSAETLVWDRERDRNVVSDHLKTDLHRQLRHDRIHLSRHDGRTRLKRREPDLAESRVGAGHFLSYSSI